MSKSQMKESYELLKKDGESFADYHRQEVERARETVQSAIENAATDQRGKPLFYAICRHVSRSGMSRTISLHYFDTKAGRMLHLNYAAAVILDRRQDRKMDGIICKGCGMDMGFDLVYALSSAMAGDGYAIEFQWL